MVRATVFVVALLLSACSTAPIDPASVEPTAAASPAETRLASPSPSAAAAKWSEPAAYSFTVDSRCGERALIGRFHVQVESGSVVNVGGLDPQARSVAAFIGPAAAPTLAEMLERVTEARRMSASEVTLRTDPGDGHPVSVNIDWQANTIDEEECYEISDFVATDG